MASVHLTFTPPDRAGFVILRIFESPDLVAGMTEIEEVTAIGVFPDYITSYSTSLATSGDNYFAIQWEDNKGATTPISARIKGGTTTLVGRVVERVMLSDPEIPEIIATQVAEMVVSVVKGTENPYDSTLTATYRQLEGMTLYALARAKMRLLMAGQGDSYTAGLVSQKSGGTADVMKLIEYLLGQVNTILGLHVSIVMLLEDVDPTGLGSVSTIQSDQSRLALTINFE